MAPPITLALFALLGAVAVGGRAAAAPIAWGTATTVAGDTDVFTTGSSVFAYNWANTNQTVNGQAFVGTASGAPTGLVFPSSSMNFTNQTAFTSGSAPFANLSTAYKTILTGAIYNSAAVVATGTFTTLTQGRSYAVQLWVGDPRGLNIPRSETLGGTGGNTVSLAFPLTTAGQLGQYSVGLFDANATTQAFSITPDNASTTPQVNAIQLRDVTNIGAWTGINGATWDASTTSNFAGNLFSAALNNTTFDAAKATLGSVVFGDSYWNSNSPTTVTQTAVTIAAGGVSANTVRFANSSLNYTVTSSDTIGLTGTSMVMKGSAGTVTLAGTNSYTGGTFIAGGVLEFGDGSLGSTGGISVNGGTLRWASGNTQDVSSRITMTAGGTTTLDTNGNSVTLASAVGNSSSGNLVKTGSGTLTLTASPTYTGTTTVSGGRLLLESPNYNGYSGGKFLIGSNATLEIASSGGANRYDFTNGTFTFDSAGSGTMTLGNAALNLVFGGTGNTFRTTGGARNTITGSAQFNLNSVAATFDVARGSDSTSDLDVGVGIYNSGAAGALTKLGGGILTLTASNAYTGSTVVSAGTLALSGTGGIDGTSGVSLSASGAALSISAASGNRTIKGLTGAAGSVVALGTNALTVSTTTSGTFAGGIDGTGGFAKAGTGLLALSGSNSYSGGTTLSGGTLAINHARALGSGTLSIAASTTLDNTSGAAIVNGGNNPQAWNGSFTFAGTNNLDLGTGAVTMSGNHTVTTSSGTLTVGGVVSNASRTLLKAGTGTLRVTNAMTLNNLQVQGGTLLLDGGSYTTTNPNGGNGLFIQTSAGATLLLRNNASVSVAQGIQIQQGTLDIDSGSVSVAGGSAPTLYIGNSTGTATLTMTGGTVTTTSFEMGNGGATSILNLNGGTLQIGASPVKASGPVTLNMGGGTLRAAAALTIPSGLPFNLSGTNGNFTLNTQGFAVTAANAISGVGGMIKAGSGTLALSAAGSYSGNTTVAAGVLSLGSGGSLANTTAVSVASGATLSLAGAANQLQSGFTRDSSNSASLAISGTLSVGANAQTVYAWTLSTTNGAIAFTDANGYLWMPNRTITFNGGSNTISGNSTNGVYLGLTSSTLTLATPLATDAVTISAALTGAGSGNFTKTGSGLVTLSGANNRIGSAFSGAWTITGTLGAAGTNVQTVYGSGITLNNGSLASLGAGDATIGAFWFTAGKTITGSGANNFITGTNVIGIQSGQTLTFSTPAASDAVTVSGNILYLGGVAKTGSGRLALSAANTYTGATTISGGTLALSGVGDIASSSGVNLSAGGAALDMSAASGARTIQSLEAVAGASVLLGGNTLTADNATNKTFAGVISGSGGFAKAGAGSLSLTNLQAFTGTARVDAGTLAISGSNTLATASTIYVASGASLDATAAGLSVVSGQTLGGYGTVSGNLAMLAGGTLSPGGSVGTLSETGDTTWNGGAHYLFEVNDANGTAGGPDGWDLFNTSGSLTLVDGNVSPIAIDLTSLSGTSSGSAADFDPNFNYAWKFVVAGSAITTFNAGWFTVDSSAFQNLPSNPERFYVARGDQLGPAFGSGTNNELYVVYAAVPEPGTLVLAGIGLAALGLVLNRRRR